MKAVLALLLPAVAGWSGDAPVHILSDTPSWLRKQPVVESFFAADVDRPSHALARPPNASSTLLMCSGRGARMAEGACSCWAGYSGTACEFAGPSWVRLPQPGRVPASRAYHSLTQAGRRLYLFGGMTFIGGKAHRVNDLHYYNIDTRRWTTPYANGHWPAHRSGHSATLIRKRDSSAERLFVFGGMDGLDMYCADLDVYTLETQTWARYAACRRPLQASPPALQ